ncbi:MAG TPA: EAL domain-containing protein [Geminicoccaceae bacterium]|nr:EAL domain-containing protein [Geminicoccus sp.]HMU49594.1 EAL domain-containing protein [Geminicoccaceae bacterium]
MASLVRLMRNSTHAALGVALVLFFAAMLLSLVKLKEQSVADDQLKTVGPWATSQAEVQLAQAQVALERYMRGADTVDNEALFEAFDISWSGVGDIEKQAGLVPDPPPLDDADDEIRARRFEIWRAGVATLRAIPARLVEEFSGIEKDVTDIRVGDVERYARIAEGLEAIREGFVESRQAIHDIRNAVEAERSERFGGLVVGLVLSLGATLVSGGLLIGFLIRETRRTRGLLHEADAARAAANEVSRDLQAVIDAVPAMVTASDPTGRYLLMNRFHADFFGMEADRAVGHLPTELGLDPAFEAEVRQVAASGMALPFFEQSACDLDGRERTLLTTKVPVRDERGRVVRIVHVSLDITDRKAAEERVRHLALHDVLTDLPNRAFLQEVAERALARAARRGTTLALHLVDLDRFKEINDTLGHPAGDALLVEVAARMAGHLRRGDTLARMGGDEFAILQEDVESPEEAAALADRILAAIAEPFRIESHHVVTGASIGLAFGPADGTDVAELVRHADLALYRAKSDGRNNVRRYEPSMNAQLRDRLALEQALREAIDSEGFQLHYQPKQTLADGRIHSVEVLLRWRHPERGAISPGQFIPVAEDSGLIVPLGTWVLRAACAEARRWLDAGLGPVRVAVNLSVEQIRRQDLLAIVRAALDDSGLPPELLELELTESLLVRDADQALRVMRDLRSLGVQLALDDFGTGYSSLAYLQRFPFDTLKIDRGFVADLSETGSSLRIVEAVVRLAHGLGLQVVAEGVETDSQLAILRRVGCDEIQGYLLSPPVDSRRIVELLAPSVPPPRRPAIARQHATA